MEVQIPKPGQQIHTPKTCLQKRQEIPHVRPKNGKTNTQTTEVQIQRPKPKPKIQYLIPTTPPKPARAPHTSKPTRDRALFRLSFPKLSALRATPYPQDQ